MGIEITHIRDVLKYTSYNSLVIFDLDNTLVEPTQELGSDQWFVSLGRYASDLIIDDKEAISLVLSIYHEVQFHIDLRAVQNEAVRVIHILQDLNIPVLALTSRGAIINEPTLKQLDKIGIQFSKQWKDKYLELQTDEPHHPIFKRGIIFCDGANKGKCLDAFLKYKQFSPKHIVMVDDKDKYLSNVASVAQQHGAGFAGLRYGYLDEKVKRFDFESSMYALHDIAHRFPPHVYDVLRKLNLSHDRYLLQTHSFFSQGQQAQTSNHQPDHAPKRLKYS